MKLRAPAKVNLHLRVLGKRADGFHEIETLMVPISLADEIIVETSAGDSVELICDDPALPQGGDNLAARAARAFAAQTGVSFAARIEIRKHIPAGAGLAGGSSDAVAVLRALDELLGTRLGLPALEALAATLGSDTAFFVRGRPALCKGRGEILESCELPEKPPLLLLKPPFGVETPWAYKHWAASREIPHVSYAPQDLGWTKIVNDLERPVFEKFTLLPVMKHWLLEQPEVRAAAMSGSGSTMFAVLKEDADAASLEARAKERFGESLWTAACRITG